MRKLTLTNHVQSDTTVLENEFIDHYMAEANGEYVKVYLILLRHLNEPSGTLTISKIADLLDITEKDVIRALNYWRDSGDSGTAAYDRRTICTGTGCSFYSAGTDNYRCIQY